MDPFESPATDSRPPYSGSLDVGQAVSEGVGAVLANIVPFVGVGILGMLIYIASCCSLIGWIIGIPLLLWGIYAFLLQALDGSGQVQTLWSGLSSLQEAFVRMWGFLLLMLLLYIPPTVAMLGLMWPDLMATLSGQVPDPVMQAVKMTVPTLVWSFVLVRLMIAPFFIVDRDMGATAALQSAWEATSGSWLKLCVLQVLFTMLTVPGQVLNVGSQIHSQQFQNDPAAALDAMPITFGLQMTGLLLSSVAGAFGMMFYASAYRQLTGPSAAETV